MNNTRDGFLKYIKYYPYEFFEKIIFQKNGYPLY